MDCHHAQKSRDQQHPSRQTNDLKRVYDPESALVNRPVAHSASCFAAPDAALRELFIG
jgi:hypothetical protein